MNIYLVLGILFVHWMGDFVLQTDKQAKGKSSDWGLLLEHTLTYTIIWFPFLCVYSGHYSELSGRDIWDFMIITMLFHTIQDAITSRINTKLFKAGKTHLFFVSVGFDQFLHFAQLLITFKLLTNA